MPREAQVSFPFIPQAPLRDHKFQKQFPYRAIEKVFPTQAASARVDVDLSPVPRDFFAVFP